MMEPETKSNCVLAVDISGSVGGSRNYYGQMYDLISLLKKKYEKIGVIGWSTEATFMTLGEFNDKYVVRMRGDDSTCPSSFVPVLKKLLMKDRCNYDLIITTDGEIDDRETDRYITKMDEIMKSSATKPDFTHVYFFGSTNSMNTNLVHAFDTYKMYINSTQSAFVAKDNGEFYDVEKDPLYINFEMENMEQLAANVIKEYALVHKSDRNIQKFRGYVEKIDRKFLKAAQNSVGFSKDNFTDLLKDVEKNFGQICRIYRSLFDAQGGDDRKWINRLYNLFNARDFKLSLFTGDTAAIDWTNYDRLAPGKVSNQPVAQTDKEEVEEVEEEDLNNYCPILFEESDHFVLVFQEVDNPDQLLVNGKSCADLRSAFGKCPLKMFEHLDYDKLSMQTIPDNISAEAFSNMAECPFPTFKSQFNTMAYGFVLYNFTDQSEITAPKTEMDHAMLQHNAFVLNHLLYGDSKIVGVKGLHVIAFLYALLQTKRMEESSRVLVRARIVNTIKRMAHLFECNLPIFSGMPPNLRVKIADAFTCATLVASEVFKNDNNIVRLLGYSSETFVAMMKQIFGLEYKHTYEMAKWNYWRWMLEFLFSGGSQSKQLDRLWAITNTKQQNWRTVNGSVMLLEGKNEGKSYNRYLDLLRIEDAFKLFAILNSTKSPLALQDLGGNVKYEVPKVVEEIDGGTLDHVHICASTCRPLATCPVTDQPWIECLPEPIKTRYDLSFFSHYHRYATEKRKLPSAKKFLAYINQKYPRTVYYKDMEETIVEVTQKFKDVITKSSITTEEYIKRSQESCSLVKRKKIETSCKCVAHHKHEC